MSNEAAGSSEIGNTIRHKSSLLDLFKNITSDNENQQTKNQLALLKHLKIKDCDQNDVTYTLNRFVKGLGAQNNNSKIGFYTALVGFIKTQNITAADVLAAINKELHSSAKNLKSEKADISCGRILAVGAVIRSGLIQTESIEIKKKLIAILITDGHKRDYLLSSAFSFVVELLDKFTYKEFKSIVVPILQEHKKEVECLDTLFLMLVLHKSMPKIQVFDKSVLKDMKHICRILMNPPKLSFQHHPVYKVFIDWLVSNNIQLVSNFSIEVDHYLQQDKSSFNKFSLALTILTHLAELITDTAAIPDILQKNLLQQMLSYCNQTRGSPKDSIKQSINKFLDKIAVNLAKDSCNQEDKIETLKRLWFNPGSVDFERIVTSKIIHQIIAGLNFEGVKQLADLLVQIIKGENINEQRHINNNQRVYAAQLLVKTISHPKANEDVSWKAQKLIILADVSLFMHPDISNELSSSLREIYFRAIDVKLPKLVDLRNVLSQLVHHIHKRLYEDMDQPRVIIDRSKGELWQDTLKRIDEFENKSPKTQQPLKQVFHTLFLNIILQIYREESIAESSLRELFSCYERASGKTSSEEDIQWIQVVVDLFLNLLSQNTHLLRSLVRCVFPHLCPHLNRDTIHQILAVFEPSSDIETLLGEDVDSDDEEEDHESDAENNEDSGESSDSDDGDLQTDDDDDAQETVNDRLRDALSTVLRSQRVIQSDEESVDVDNMEEEEASKLDAALASAFKQFRPNTGKKSKKQSKEEQTLTHFRVRVLDLIDIYIDSAPPMHLTLEVMLPLLQCLEFCIRDVHQLPLLRRISHCLKKLGAQKKFSTTEGVTQQVLHDLLRSLLEKGSKSALMMQDMSNQLTECCLFVLRCSNMLLTIGEGTKQTRNDVVKDLVVKELQKFLFQRDCLTPQQFFKNILGSAWSGNILLVNELLEKVFDENVRPFKRSQALDMLRMFYLNNRFISGCTDAEKLKLKKLERNIVHKTAATLINEEGVKLKDKFVTNLFNLLQAVKKSPLESEVELWKSLGETIRAYRSGVTLSKDSKSSYTKLCHCLGIKPDVEMKKSTVTLEPEQEIEKADGVGKPKVKAKGHKERKERKAAQMLRMQSLSEGLEELMPFSTSAEVKDTEDMNDGDTKTKFKSKKSKKRTRSVNVEENNEPVVNGSSKKQKTKKVK